jgi:hypothetical protein
VIVLCTGQQDIEEAAFTYLSHTYFPFVFTHVVVLCPPVHLSPPFPLWTHCTSPLGAAIAFEMARGAIANAAVAAIMTAAITSVFVCMFICIYIWYYKKVLGYFSYLCSRICHNLF